MLAIWLFVGVLYLSYAVFIVWIRFGYRKVIAHEYEGNWPVVNLIIPSRNEASNIVQLTSSIEALNYPPSKLKVLFIDDHSLDHTVELIRKTMAHSRFSWHVQKNSKEGKKQALQTAIYACTEGVIVQTDADCTFRENWLKSLMKPFADEKVKMVAGPVGFVDEENDLTHLQQLDLASLVVSSIGLSKKGYQVMCNGANLAYRWDAFSDIDLNEQSASGDDVFRMQKLAELYPDSIVYLNQHATLVSTSAESTIVDWVKQRMRWGSKTSEYPNKVGLWLAVYIFILNCTQLGLYILALVDVTQLVWIIPVLCMRFVLDYWLLQSYFKQSLHQKVRMGSFFIMSILNPFYFTLTGMLSQLVSTDWKGRKVKPISF